MGSGVCSTDKRHSPHLSHPENNRSIPKSREWRNMERRSGVKQSTNVAVCLVVGLLLVMGAHRSDALDLKKCYKQCFLPCVKESGASLPLCIIKCVKDCISHPASSLGLAGDTSYFCKLGCSMSQCTHLSTETNAGKFRVWFLFGLSSSSSQSP